MTKPLIVASPHPRALDEIFTPEALARLRARYRLAEVHRDSVDSLEPSVLGQVRYILGQPPLSAGSIEAMGELRAILNVESNLFLNMPYEPLFARGVHVLTTGRVFAEPVAEIGLGFALCLARDIIDADLAFRLGQEKWGGEGNRGARLLGGSEVGLIGFGDLGRALLRLLRGFDVTIRAYDPWVPPSMLREQGVEPADLDRVLAESDFIFCVASVTAENEGFLGAEHFARMRWGASFILLSRAGVVDFEALMDAVERGAIRAASDVYPQEPLGAEHRARRLPGLLRSAHRAGALESALLGMGEMVLEDMDLMDRDLPPMRCKRAERETVARMRSKPVEKT